MKRSEWMCFSEAFEKKKENLFEEQIIQLSEHSTIRWRRKLAAFLKIIFFILLASLPFLISSHRLKLNREMDIQVEEFNGHFLSSMSFCGLARVVPGQKNGLNWNYWFLQWNFYSKGKERRRGKVDMIIISGIILANPILFVIGKIAFAKSLYSPLFRRFGVERECKEEKKTFPLPVVVSVFFSLWLGIIGKISLEIMRFFWYGNRKMKQIIRWQRVLQTFIRSIRLFAPLFVHRVMRWNHCLITLSNAYQRINLRFTISLRSLARSTSNEKKNTFFLSLSTNKLLLFHFLNACGETLQKISKLCLFCCVKRRWKENMGDCMGQGSRTREEERMMRSA